MLRNVTLRSVLIALIILAVLAFGIFLWPVPQIVQAVRHANPTEATGSVVGAIENTPTEAPEEIDSSTLEPQPLPAGVNVEKMSTCNDADQVGSWQDDKQPFTGTQLVCGSDGYWDIVQLFYNGVEYKVPVTENVAPAVITESTDAASEAKIIDFPVPGNYSPLRNDNGELIGITYPIQDKGPHSIPSCFKCTLVVAVGKFTFSGTIANPFTGLFGASEVTGNILAGVCDNESGCVTPMIGAKSGHIQVTIVFPGYEIPNESVTWAVNFMFNPESSNCGDGCLEVYVGNFTTGMIKKFDNTITPTDLDLVAPDGPYSKINIIVDGTPSGSKVITNDAGDPIGQKYYLADKDAFISIPEDGGTVFYFGAPGCTRDGISQKVGDVVTMYGIDTDGGTPHDQNETVEVVCSQPEMVLVHFFHGGIFEDEVAKLKSEYPDWIWP